MVRVSGAPQSGSCTTRRRFALSPLLPQHSRSAGDPKASRTCIAAAVLVTETRLEYWAAPLLELRPLRLRGSRAEPPAGACSRRARPLLPPVLAVPPRSWPCAAKGEPGSSNTIGANPGCVVAQLGASPAVSRDWPFRAFPFGFRSECGHGPASHGSWWLRLPLRRSLLENEDSERDFIPSQPLCGTAMGGNAPR